MNVLVLAPHPDDETIGCGGTLLRHKANGDNLFWLIFTRAYEPNWTQTIIDSKAEEIEAVANAYGDVIYTKYGYRTTQLDQIHNSQLIADITVGIETFTPEIVYSPWGGDVLADHRAVYDAASYVLRPIGMKRLGVKRWLCYDTSPTQSGRPFVPNCYVDITDYIRMKSEIMWSYKTEVQEGCVLRNPRGVRARAANYGLEIGVEYAEAFIVMNDLTI